MAIYHQTEHASLSLQQFSCENPGLTEIQILVGYIWSELKRRENKNKQPAFISPLFEKYLPPPPTSLLVLWTNFLLDEHNYYITLQSQILSWIIAVLLKYFCKFLWGKQFSVLALCTFSIFSRPIPTTHNVKHDGTYYAQLSATMQLWPICLPQKSHNLQPLPTQQSSRNLPAT